MSEDAVLVEATVLWFRPELGRGSVKADSGRHYLFANVDGVHEVAPGLRVRVRAPAAGAAPPESISILPLPHGRREFAAIEEPPPKKRTRAAKSESAPKAPRAPAPPKREGPKAGPVPPVRRGKNAFAPGVSVRHTVHGPGFVVISSPTVTRVRFLDGQERNCKAGDLTLLD